MSHVITIKTIGRAVNRGSIDKAWVASGECDGKFFHAALLHGYGENYCGPWSFSDATAPNFDGPSRAAITRVLSAKVKELSETKK